MSRSLGFVLVTLLLMTVQGSEADARAAGPVSGGGSARAAAVEGIVPEFEMSLAAEGVPGARSELRVRDIVVIETSRGESVAITCRGCRGQHAFGPSTAQGAEITFAPRRLVVGARSRLLVSVIATGKIGRYKEYASLNARVGSRKLLQQGCLAPGGVAHVSCSLAVQTELDSAAASPSCPAAPCLAVSRTTGFQIGVGANQSTSTAQHNGSIVAWTIALGRPASNQIEFFNANEGGPAEAALAVLRPVAGAEVTYQLVAQSPTVALEPYFGTTHKFVLTSVLPIDQGDVVALNVPTWAPALAQGLGDESTWRSSRPSGQCTNTSAQSAQLAVGGAARYGCLYQTAQLTYSATLNSIP
jgi:hypothetical protein